jgi:2-oxoglutarate dehydrogenase E1 component
VGQSRVDALIREYRLFGHLAARTDPFGRARTRPSSLELDHHGLTESDLDRSFNAGTLSPSGGPIPLREIVERLESTYCSTVGVEFAHITDSDERQWLQDRIERSGNRTVFSREDKAHILFQLHRAELFEKFCGKRYPGVKRFSLEGGESLIAMLDAMIERAGDKHHVEEIVLAMSHRGRLNVLTNIVGKTYEQIFTEFEDAWAEDAEMGGGDVKYHKGYSTSRVLRSGRHVWLAMTSNPSHLESVAPVAVGRCRAKQRLRDDVARERVMPLLIHGDAAFIGQGIVAELFNMSRLDGYTVGGSMHVVVNNLIGFTTGEADARSSTYCTDMAKIIEAPVFHVSGEDPEACVHAINLALDYKARFKRDVVVDLVCYRRHGHNEMDEAAFTQPQLYKMIKAMPSVVTTYAAHLEREGVITAADREGIRKSLDESLDKAFLSARQAPVDPTPDPGHRQWTGIRNDFTFDAVDTGVSVDHLAEIAAALGRWPEGFTPHPKLAKLMHDRAAVIEHNAPIDWGTAEALAFGSLLCEGIMVRLSGQDSRRGTFSHRHAVLTDFENGERYTSLNHIREAEARSPDLQGAIMPRDDNAGQARFYVYDSPLSEFAVLGFEYGFSIASPSILALWEAQFGDFVNGAQVVIDQFIASAEAKWQRWSGLVLLLPHGYEGQGPEHSSARLERFLKLCGQKNMQVCHPTTPAQYFHLLRRQIHRPFRKPLIVMTPKSLLRLPQCVSTVSELSSGGFQEIMDDPAMLAGADRRRIKRLVLCSGKVFYDLVTRRAASQVDDVAIVRVEQLYPLHADRLEDIVSSYPGAELIWAQEEPKNQGAYGHMMMALKELFGWELRYAGRATSASPATGSPHRHEEELDELLTQAVGPAHDAGSEHHKPHASAKAGVA